MLSRRSGFLGNLADCEANSSDISTCPTSSQYRNTALRNDTLSFCFVIYLVHCILHIYRVTVTSYPHVYMYVSLSSVHIVHECTVKTWGEVGRGRILRIYTEHKNHHYCGVLN